MQMCGLGGTSWCVVNITQTGMIYASPLARPGFGEQQLLAMHLCSLHELCWQQIDEQKMSYTRYFKQTRHRTRY